MLAFFESMLKLLKFQKIETDNFVFRLHYKFTFPVLVLFSLMLTSTQYFGNPIDCTTTGVDKSIVSTYCWTHGTYTVQNLEGVTIRAPTKAEKTQMTAWHHLGHAHPGIQTSDPSRNRRQYYRFYQWVAFVLFLQGVCFYGPRFIWKKMLENGKMKFLTSGMKEPTLDVEEKKKRVLKLSLGHDKLRGKNNTYAMCFFAMEILNLLNLFVQMWLTDIFLHGKFLNYGSRVVNYVDEFSMGSFDWNPMDEVFPKIAKCQFNKHGVGGGIQNHDALCILPLNIVNEKIYLVLWWWYIFLSVFSALAVIYRLTSILLPDLRSYMLWKSQREWSPLERICRNKPYGDWFLLRQMAKNVDEETFDEFLDLLCKEGRYDEDYGTKKTLRKAQLPRSPPLYSDSGNGVSNPSLQTEETDFSIDNRTLEKK